VNAQYRIVSLFRPLIAILILTITYLPSRFRMNERVLNQRTTRKRVLAKVFTSKANSVNMRAFIFGVCFLLVSRFADGQLQSRSEGGGLEFDDDDNYVSVIVGYKTRAAMANFGPDDRRVLRNVRQFERMDAVTMQIPVSELDSLQNDPDVAYVEEDTMVHLFAEERSWGIPAIQADTTSIPSPNSDNDCFKICIIDSGLLVRHPDIVSPFVRSLRLSILLFALPDNLSFIISRRPAL
jgi:hypothetical protein